MPGVRIAIFLNTDTSEPPCLAAGLGYRSGIVSPVGIGVETAWASIVAASPGSADFELDASVCLRRLQAKSRISRLPSLPQKEARRWIASSFRTSSGIEA